MEPKRQMSDAEMARWNLDHPWTSSGLRCLLMVILNPRLFSDALPYRVRRKLGLVHPVGYKYPRQDGGEVVVYDEEENNYHDKRR